VSRRAEHPKHGDNHSPGGSDPITGLSATRVFGAGWSGPFPQNILDGAVWKVPKVEGSDMTFDLVRLLFRLETPGTTSTTVRVEKSSSGNAVFSASTVGTITANSGVYEPTPVTAALGSVTSGDELRIVWVARGTGARGYLVAVEGTEQ
jgi:hypothetical protein